MTFSEALMQQNIAYTTTTLKQQVFPADEDLAALFRLDLDAPILELQRVRHVENKPIIYFANYVPTGSFPQIEQKDFSKRRLFDVMEHDYGFKIAWAQRYFEACTADAQVAAALNISTGSAVMYAKQITYSSNDVPIETSDIWIRGDSFRLSATVLRGKSLNLLNGVPDLVQSEIRI